MSSQEQNQQRYMDAMHAVQSGVKLKMEFDSHETSPKGLRVGVNSAMIETATLQRLLVAKGIITWDEWWEALADMAENEQRMYEDWLNEHLGTQEGAGRVHLA